MGKKHERIVEKVVSWFRDEYPNCEIKKKVKMYISLSPSNYHYFEVDIVVTEGNSNKIGVECKSLTDSNTFRDLCCGIGQAYVYQKKFGRSFLAVECSEKWLSDKHEMLKRRALFPNINIALNIGILLVSEKVVCIENGRRMNSVADSLFIEKKDVKRRD